MVCCHWLVAEAVSFVCVVCAQVAREIAIACEDLVNGTVTAVSEAGVTVSYTLSDGTPVEVRVML